MDSDPKDEDTSTKHILDYYKKYSQNRELPKYFSGTSMSYLPEIKDSSCPEAEITTSIKTDINIIVTTEDINEVNENIGEPVTISRASSPMSNHKLEWDSGADIGYGNCQEKRLRKSLSLPTIADLVQKKSDRDFGPVTSNVVVTRSQSSNSDGNVKIVLLPCSSSSEYQSDENMYPSQFKKKVSSSSSSSNAYTEAPVNTESSSSSSANANANLLNSAGISISSSDSNKKQSLKQFASTLSYLKQKIGIPDAHSTPKFPEERQNVVEEVCSTTPRLKKSPKIEIEVSTSSENAGKKLMKKPCNLMVVQEKITHKNNKLSNVGVKNVKKYQNQKIINLALTKPITVECTCSGQSLTSRSLQTVTKQSTVAVQTDEITEKELSQIIQNCQKTCNNQSLIYFEYSESDKISGQSTQTDSDVVESNCDSFEYLVKQPSELKNGVSDNLNSNHEIKLGVPSRIDSVLPVQEQAINLKRTQRTCDLTVNHSEENSEKSSSKEFCLGNLVSASLLDNVEEDIGKSIYLLQRLLKSKKYDPVTKKRYIKKIIKKITESKYLEESSTSSDLFIPKKLSKADSSGDKNGNNLGNNLRNNPLQSNVPWYPASELKLSPKRKKLVQKTFTQDFVPDQHSSKEEFSSAPEIVPINSRDMRKNRFTLTNNEFSVNHKYASMEENKSSKTYSETDSTSLEKHYESSSTAKSYQNWKEDKTLSEKMLEKQSGDKSSEKSHSSKGNGDCFVKLADKERQFQISWINNEISHLGKLKGLLEKPSKIIHKNPLKTTNVYTVFNENDTPSKPKHNYVIETLIGTQTSSEMNFKLDGEVYTVQEYLNSKKKRAPKRPRQVTGSIEVVSSDSTTNIKVTTYCEECKQTICICNLAEDEKGCTCNGKCGSESCFCQSESLANTSTSVPLSKKSTSQDCCKTCYICKMCPCTCDTERKKLTKMVTTNSSDDLLGTFIPIDPLRSTVVKFSTFPSTSKEENIRKQNFLPSSQEVDVIDQATSTVLKSINSQKDEGTSYGSLRKVFENCACTQTSCTCDFVEKLINRFSKTDIPGPTVYDSKSLQTDKSDNQSVGLQTRIDTQNQNQQTTTLTLDDKSLQTEEYMGKDENQTVGLQTWVNNQNQIQQTSVDVADAQTELLKLEDNFQNIGIQTKTDVRDQILQTSRSLDEQQHDFKTSVGTHISVNGGTQTKGVSFVDEATSPTIRSVGASPDHSVKNKDASASPTVQSAATSSDNITKQQDATTSPMIHSVATSAHNITKQNDAAVSARGLSVGTSAAQTAGASQTSARKAAPSHSDSSRASTSKSSSSTSDRRNKKVICVCCCTQTKSISQVKSRGRNVKLQIGSNGLQSDKENVKHKGDSLTTNSTTYEICPSILVSSYNDTSRSISEDSESKSQQIVCVCCNEKYSMDKISILGSKNENYPLCCNCLAKRPILTSVCYAGPEENCPCSKPSSYKSAQIDLSDDTKKTATDSNDLEEYCTCTKPFQFKNSKYCSYCQFKLRNTAKSKNGIAYTLTLEADCLNKVRRKRKKISLEEIRLKVPSPSRKKKHKDKENVSKRDQEERKREKGSDKDRKCDCGRIICTSNCHIHGVSSKHRRDKNSLTLQEYLQKNRPDFIHSAESRRDVVLNSKSDRVSGQVDAKLKFAEENMGQHTLKKARRLFTEQEMKEITKRNYKKLPEVKEKINNKKEQRIRNADRFIVDVFARKIQRSVLKGKSSFPIDSNVICLPKTCNC